jgi:hypothetical protein
MVKADEPDDLQALGRAGAELLDFLAKTLRSKF